MFVLMKVPLRAFLKSNLAHHKVIRITENFACDSWFTISRYNIFIIFKHKNSFSCLTLPGRPGKLLARHRPAESTDVFFVSLSNISQNMAACKHF